MRPKPPTPFQFTPSRATQPYRDNGQRHPSLALQNMQRGTTLYGQNPMDQQRQFQTGMRPPEPGSLGWYLLRLNQFYSSR